MDNGRFAPMVILTDMAKGFAAAFEALQAKGIWLNTKHLWCRWHIYEAIRRHCKDWFLALPKQIQRATMDKLKGQNIILISRFIDAFRKVVLAPTTQQMLMQVEDT